MAPDARLPDEECTKRQHAKTNAPLFARQRHATRVFLFLTTQDQIILGNGRPIVSEPFFSSPLELSTTERVFVLATSRTGLEEQKPRQ